MVMVECCSRVNHLFWSNCIGFVAFQTKPVARNQVLVLLLTVPIATSIQTFPNSEFSSQVSSLPVHLPLRLSNMECQNIHPAHLDLPSNQMSPEEFQKMLYTWFEEKGLVADLRSHLRLQMINKLRNTMVGKIERPLKAMSLTKQAFSLAIAEHLLKDECLYTLSIFSTEMPVVANHLPFSPFDAAKYTENQWRFDEESVINILELLGIPKGTSESIQITTCYYKSGESLLTCVIKLKLVCLPQASTAINDDEDLKEYLEKVLISFPKTLIAELHQKIRQKMDRENLKAKSTFDNVIDDLKKQMRTLINSEMLLKKENKHLKDELKQWRKVTEQVKLKKDALTLEEERIRKKFEEIGQLEQELRNKPAECKSEHCGEPCENRSKTVEDLRKALVGFQEADRAKSLEIEKLNLKVCLLIKDLENAQAKVEFLNSCLKQSNHIYKEQAGGDSNFVQASDESSDNLTDEIIKQVHTRLRKLEHESDQLDVKFKKLQIMK